MNNISTDNLVNYVRFEPSASDCPDNFGHYYTDYNPRTREGQGILGTIDKPLYMFKFRLVFAPEYNTVHHIRRQMNHADLMVSYGVAHI